jgi:hypothetical protein
MVIYYFDILSIHKIKKVLSVINLQFFYPATRRHFSQQEQRKI